MDQKLDKLKKLDNSMDKIKIQTKIWNNTLSYVEHTNIFTKLFIAQIKYKFTNIDKDAKFIKSKYKAKGAQ